MNIHGTYLVCGGEDEPALHFLTPSEIEALLDRSRIAGDSEKSRKLVLRHTFRADALYALPAWLPECMADIAQGYTGTHGALVRGMAATLALGRYAERSEPVTGSPPAVKAPRPATGLSGGRTVKAPKPAPSAPSAPGAFFAGLRS